MIALLSPSFLLSSCSLSDDGISETNPKDEKPEIRFNPDVWNFMEGTRAATFDSQSDLQSLAHFYCAVYNSGTLTSYITPGQVSYANSQWTFDSGKHYWPASGSLDFYAYAPVGGVNYISDLIYAATPNVTFNCVNLPMTNAEQDVLEEFIYDIKPGLNKEGSASGVTLSFQHPFTKIKLQLSASHPDIQINKITFKSIKNNGSYSHNGSPKWTTTGDATNLVLTFTGSDANFTDNVDDPLTQIGPTFLMIPQEWAGDIEVEAVWNDWGAELTHKVTASVPTTWAAGYSYTYTFTITETDLIVKTDKFTEQW